MSRTRRLLVLLVLLGSVGNLGAATTASFTASTTNPAAQFATGALVLGNDVGSDAVDESGVCFSTSGVDTDLNEGDCDQLFPVAVNKPGDTVEVLLDITNAGNLPGDLTVFAEATCTSAPDLDVPYHGSSDLCEGVQLTIQQSTLDTRLVDDTCVYPTVGATCSFDPAKTLEHFTATHTPANQIDMGELAPDATRFLTISLFMDETLDNTFQGLQASWTITWFIEQLPAA